MKKIALLSLVAVFALFTFTGCGGGGGSTTTTNPPVVNPTPKAPEAPQNVTAVSTGISSAKISFTATSDGGSPVTSYTVTSSDNITASGTTSPITITGLPISKQSSFTVVANNALGSSPPATSRGSVTPTANGAMPYMVRDGVNLYSFVLRADGGYFCQNGSQTREVKVLPDNSYYFNKTLVPKDSGFICAIASKETTDAGKEIFFLKINKLDFSFTLKSISTASNFDDAAIFEDESFFQIIYIKGVRQYLEKIDFDGNHLQLLTIEAGYSYDYIGVTKTRIYLVGDVAQGSYRNRIVVTQLDRNYNILGDSQQRPFEVNDSIDYTTGFSLSEKGILITGRLSISVTDHEAVLFSMDLETGTFTQLYSIKNVDFINPIYDSTGNVITTISGIEYAILKLTPDGKVWKKPLTKGVNPSQIFFDGENAIALHYNGLDNAGNGIYTPTPLKIFSLIESWTLVP